MKEKISVIMSVYNDEKNIANAVESILSQTYENFEFLILDDFSTDGTLSILDSYHKQDSRIYLHKNKKNLGLTKSLNILIKKCKGQIIARQDSDDVSYKERFHLQRHYLLDNDLDACTTLAKVKNSNKVIPNISQYLNPKLVIKFKNPFIHGSLMIHTEVLKKIGMYDENFYYAQDFKLIKDLIANSYNIKIMKKVLYELNMVENISQIYKEEQSFYAQCVKKNLTPGINQ